jgi:hypothetical protein
VLAWILAATFVFVPTTTGLAGDLESVTVKTRMTGWESRAGKYYRYREGSTARLVVGVWPRFPHEIVKARLEWRRAHRPWRVLDVSRTRLNRDGRALFRVRNVPARFSFRIRAAMAATDEHFAGRSDWSYFRAR